MPKGVATAADRAVIAEIRARLSAKEFDKLIREAGPRKNRGASKHGGGDAIAVRTCVEVMKIRAKCKSVRKACAKLAEFMKDEERRKDRALDPMFMGRIPGERLGQSYMEALCHEVQERIAGNAEFAAFCAAEVERYLAELAPYKDGDATIFPYRLKNEQHGDAHVIVGLYRGPYPF